MALTKFPLEILCHIFSELPRCSLVALCKVHPHLRRAAEPHLYDTIELTRLQGITPPIKQLLRSILRRPELASYVRHLRLLGTDFKLVRYVRPKLNKVICPKMPVDPTELEPLVETISSLNFPDDFVTRWVAELQAGTMDAFVALLLTRLPHLKSLRMEKNFTLEAQLVGEVFRTALYTPDHPPMFDQLQHVVFSDEYNQYRRFYSPDGTAKDVLPLFYLPAARSLEAFVDTPPVFQWPTIQPELRNLTSLTLWMLRETALDKVLASTPCLKSLRWSWYYGPMYKYMDWGRVIDLGLVAAALGRVKDTLESLHIEAAIDNQVGHYELDRLQMRGSLRSIKKIPLKSLFAPWSFLVGFSQDREIRLEEVIPETVEHLTITNALERTHEWQWDDDDDMADMFPAVFERRKATAQLCSLKLEMVESTGHWSTDSEASRRLAEICQEYDVSLNIKQFPRPMQRARSPESRALHMAAFENRDVW